MGIKVGINGFGRIGRVVFRTCMENPDIEVTAINDPAINVDYITYLITFDSTHGKFKGSVINNQTEVIVNGMTIKVFNEELPESIPWDSAGVRYVVEASGVFTSCDKAAGHLCGQSVRRVIVAAPSADVPMIVLGVNHKKMTSDLSVVSGASSTLYCLAPIIKVLDDNFGLSEGFVTSIHAMTPSLKPLDGLCMRGRHWRDHRSIHQNIIPANTGACKALAKILPRTKDKLAGIAFRVPIVDVSALDITVRLNVGTTLQSIIKCVEQASATNLKRIIKTSNEGAVSSDFIGDSFSCILDVESCIQLRPNFYKLICWYENEYSYANRIVNTITLSEEIAARPMNPPKMARILKPKKTCRGKGDPCGEGSDDFTNSTSSRGVPKRGQSPDVGASSRSRKNTDVFNIWSDVPSTKPCQSAPIKPNRGFLHNLVPVTTTLPVAKLSPECLKKLHRDFSNTTNTIELDTPDTPKLQQRSPEPSDLDLKFIVNKLSAKEKEKDRQRGGKQRKNSSPMPRDKRDNIQMTAVLRDIPPDPNTSSSHTSHCLDINIANDRSAPKERGRSFDKVPSDHAVTLSTYETSHKMPSVSKSVSHKNEIKKRQHIVTEVETHPIRSISSSHRPLPDSKTEDTASQSDVMDDTLAKTIDLFVDGLTHGQIFQNLMDDTDTKEPKPLPGEKTPPKRRQDNALVERISGMAELVRFVEIPRTKSKRAMQSADWGNRDQQDLNVQIESSTDYNESETFSINLEGAGRRSTLIIDMQHQYDGPETERDGHSDDEEMLGEADPVCCQSSLQKGSDIYDKVESTSVTDSDNSLNVMERKSEVIQLTDLTRGTSLDDLVKLDKICRIMEISDELSDKLFSALPKAETAGMRDKWSFKELCEKIKFDEFCGAVFDK